MPAHVVWHTHPMWHIEERGKRNKFKSENHKFGVDCTVPSCCLLFQSLSTRFSSHTFNTTLLLVMIKSNNGNSTT